VQTESETFITRKGEGRKQGVNKVERLREVKVTTVRKVRLARVCAMGGKDVV